MPELRGGEPRGCPPVRDVRRRGTWRYSDKEKGMSQADAYMLCSVAVDVNITELVDGNVGVHCLLSKAIFKK